MKLTRRAFLTALAIVGISPSPALAHHNNKHRPTVTVTAPVLTVTQV